MSLSVWRESVLTHQPNRQARRKHRQTATGLNRRSRVVRLSLCVAILCSGCLQRDESLKYPFRDSDVRYYKDVAQDVAYPTVVTETPGEIAFSEAPRTVLSRDASEPWDMSLTEAVHIALQNNDIIRSAGQFLSPGNVLLTNGQNVPSVYDPGISESGVLFGTRGVEAALSAFDANFTTSMIWGRDEQVQNNPFFAGGLMPGATLTRETGSFQAGLRKDFAYGGQFQLNHTVNYLGSNAPGQLFPSTYTGLVQALYRQPLWAGAGTEYTRIAGPITQSFGGLSGVTQGVVIARINNDISIADFQAAIRNLVKDTEDTYWDLYLSYRNYDTAVTARNAALATWRFAKIRVELDADIDVADESQARDQYFAAEALVENTRSAIFTNETRLRRLLGLPVNEGRVIRPADEPITAEFDPDWQTSLTEALVHRVELRKQKWNIKSLELQLAAANSLTKPRLDFVGGYQVNGFGDDLLKYNDSDAAGTAQGLNSYYETLTQGNQTGWSLGFEFTMPIGFRSAHSQVRNIELRLSKAHQVLYTQELEVAHELAVAFQELTRAYASAQSNYNRRKAAMDNVSTIETQVELGDKTVDEILRAQDRRARAEIDFFTAMVDYNKALTNFHFRKGTLLQDTNVTLMEDGWNPDAYVDAYRQAQARTAAIDARFKHTEPVEFANPTPLGSVQFANPLPEINQIEQFEVIEEPLPPTDGTEKQIEEFESQPSTSSGPTAYWEVEPIVEPESATSSSATKQPAFPNSSSSQGNKRQQSPSLKESTDDWEIEPLPPPEIEDPPTRTENPPTRTASEAEISPIGYWRTVDE